MNKKLLWLTETPTQGAKSTVYINTRTRLDINYCECKKRRKGQPGFEERLGKAR